MAGIMCIPLFLFLSGLRKTSDTFDNSKSFNRLHEVLAPFFCLLMVWQIDTSTLFWVLFPLFVTSKNCPVDTYYINKTTNKKVLESVSDKVLKINYNHNVVLRFRKLNANLNLHKNYFEKTTFINVHISNVSLYSL